ncbi:bifunctional 4-hydroxy-2-oxoglutarate aldolase/2-dehydro-3-deoxy-phosphogluconate aldolase [Brevibacillus sp. H7]|uniref:bifunctional 4-hydroxy-2-oxoglutarate aldolase/2-dehydro-3-deoxy-phosphogluconate aldolase n=1 Tax=Brevibacillus sp. H7 TaxID=3349138 RepID=UPI003823F8A5
MLPKVAMLQKIVEGGVIAILRQVPQEQAERLADSLVEGGVTALEVTVQTPEAFSMIQTLAKRLQGRAVVGAGTVIDGETARLAINSGADFLFSPSLHQDVIRTALRYGKIAMPGVMTPTEMITAMEWGADLVKVFPAATLGVSYIKDVKGPFPHIPLVPVGGIHLENVASFIRAGAVAVGVGSNLVNRQLMERGAYDEITRIAEQYVQAIKAARV